jgi:cytosine/adenosine deaminase-related metal-dependent hydrolase
MVDLNSRGLLGPDVTVAHCTGLPEDDLDALASSEAGIALTPTTDMTSGVGSPPMQALLDRDVSPGLGVGDDFAGSGDMFAQMRAAISIQHARYFDLKLAGKGGLPNLLTTRNVIRYGTISGAGAVGLESATGSIEVGKQADLILLRTDRANIHPVNDPIGAVVWGMDTSNLDWVFAAGEVLMRSGDQTADVGRARSLAVEARNRFRPAPGHTAESDAGSRV